MLQSLKGIALTLAPVVFVYFGFIEEVQGARNLVVFWVWAVCLPLGLFMLIPVMQDEAAKKDDPPRPIARFIAQVAAWTQLAVFVWTGSIATAVAWGFSMLCFAIARQHIKTKREASKKEQAPPLTSATASS